MRKLVLEELDELDNELTDNEDEGFEDFTDLSAELTDEEKGSFEVSTVCDLLKDYLDKYSYLTNILNTEDNNISEKIRLILSSVIEDTAVIIGKLQQSLKEVSTNESTDTIDEGEKNIEEITSTIEG